MTSARIALIALPALLAIGCDQPLEPPAPTTDAPVSGTVVGLGGAEIPADAQLAVIWVVSAGSPDTEYLFGAGQADAERFEVDFAGFPPPAPAVNDYAAAGYGRLGVGMIIALPPDYPLPADGPINRGLSRELLDAALGGADRFSVLYVEGDFPADHWTSAFERGVLRCGRGLEPEGDSPFDRFEPVECSELELRYGDALDWVNWT